MNNPNLGADSAHDSALEVIALYEALPVKVADTTQHVIPSVTTATATMTSGKMNIYMEVLLVSASILDKISCISKFPFSFNLLIVLSIKIEIG